VSDVAAEILILKVRQ